MSNETLATGPRLYLSSVTPDEIDDAFARMYSNEDGKNTFFRRSGRPFSRDELRDFCRSGLQSETCFYYAVRANDTGELLGSVRVGVIDRKNSLSDMVVLIGQTGDRGKGLGTEAIKLGNRIAFERHNIRKLHGGVLAANTASLVAYLRAGWVEEGRLLNHYLVDGKPMDWIIISCFNPSWLSEQQR